MTIHREGTATILLTAIVLAAMNFGFYKLFENNTAVFNILLFLSIGLWLFIISFFRIPNRNHTIDSNKIVSPADGKVVVIEEVYDEEYFKEKVLQISVFMSPANVHVNRNPMDGEIIYNQYHKGKYLVAWDPKSSTENERWSVVTKNSKGKILYKQIAGALAKRICNYTTVGQQVKQTDEYGFIKFGSRVDVLLPLGTKVNVQLNQMVQGGVTSLASWN